MNTSTQLTRALRDKAMPLADIFALRDQLRRCVRCRNLDADESRCMVGEVAGMFIEYPAEFGCVAFEDAE